MAMLDAFMNRHGMAADVLHTDSYAPGQAVTSRRLLNESGSGLAVLFPPWHNAGWFYEHLSKRLVARNWAVLDYEFHAEILKPNSSQVLDSFNEIATKIAADVNKLEEIGRHDDIYLIGTSLGNVALALAANKMTRFTRADLVVGGASLARGTWDGSRTRHIRDHFAKEYVTYEDLEQDWASLSPLHNSSIFGGKDVRVLRSTTDTIIPATDQQLWSEGLVASGAKVTDNKTRLGHFATIVRYCVFDEPAIPTTK